MSLAVDHLVLCVQDLNEAVDEIEGKGLASVQGGRHQGHGTANRIVPLGDAYLELVAVVDVADAVSSPFGKWVLEKSRRGLAVDAVCLRTHDLDEVGRRLGLESTAMSRTRPDGVELRWRLAGLEEALTRSLPFFIEWGVPDEMLPGASPVSHPAGSAALDRVVMAGDAKVLRSWVGDAGRLEVESAEKTVNFAELITPTGVVRI